MLWRDITTLNYVFVKMKSKYVRLGSASHMKGNTTDLF